MKIIGFNLTKILVEKKEKLDENLKITQNIDIKNISEEDIKISKNKAIKIDFNLKIEYSKDYARIELEGNIMTLPDGDDTTQLLDAWKSKKIPEYMRVPIFNFIMNKCNIKALYLEDEMSLPLHIPMPKVVLQNKKNDKNLN
ncbi:MAG: hypothetical protein AABW83_01760 [Nanoarchaeota archaeon]